jgi:hypothetical protein
MNDTADYAQQILVAFLFATGSMVLLLPAIRIMGRAIENIKRRRRVRLVQECQPLVDKLLLPNPSVRIAEQLACYVPRHGAIVAQLLVAPARYVTGPAIVRLRRTARAFGAVDKWMRELSDRRWWVKTDAARALGQLKEPSAVDALIATLDDNREEVRAAVVEALGMIGDPRSVPALVSRLPERSGHQRVLVVEALRGFGRAVVPSLMSYEQLHPEDRAVVAELLGQIAASDAIDDLLRWTADERSAVRVAAMRALGSIGLHERGYYYALRALSIDADAEVRAMAARALGRTGRADAAPYLAKHLKDEWPVAVHAARGLRSLGPAGVMALRRHADEDGTAGSLARQILRETAGDASILEAVAV